MTGVHSSRWTAAAFLALAISLTGAHAQPGADSGPSFGQINPEQMARMVNPVEDGPFYMINLIKYREKAVYPDGRETDLTGEEANNLYRPVDILAEIGAEPVFMAQVEKMRLGDGTNWDQVAIVRYPSRRAFVQMTQRPDFQARSVHKDAGVGQTIVMVSHLIDLPTPEGSTPPEPAYPATADDRPFEMIHVLRYRDTARYEEGSTEPAISGREAMKKYGAAAGSVAGPMGVHPTAWFRIEGVLIGDGRSWDEMRINHFPSHATLAKHLESQVRAEAQRHRAAALADTYAIQARPLINRLGGK